MSIYGNPLMLGGGGGGAVYMPAVYRVGYYNNAPADARQSLDVVINGFNGKYGLISFMHRGNISSTPQGLTLLDRSEYLFDNIYQWVSVYKCSIDSAAKTYTFTQDSSQRCSATAWALESDYSITKTRTDVFSYYTSKYTMNTTDLTFFTFSAVNAQTGTAAVGADSDGAWICQPYPRGMQLRHFTGFIHATTNLKSTWIYEEATETITTGSPAQVNVYTIST